MLLMGEVSEEDLQEAFAQQAQAQADAGADGIVIETMSDLAEIKLAIAAAKETGLPVVACMTFDSGAKLRPHHDGRYARKSRRAINRSRSRCDRCKLRTRYCRIHGNMLPIACRH